MTPELTKIMNELRDKEMEQAALCCDTCHQKFINSTIYWDYGFTAAVQATTEKHDQLLADARELQKAMNEANQQISLGNSVSAHRTLRANLDLFTKKYGSAE